jgi:hypothetical protein
LAATTDAIVIGENLRLSPIGELTGMFIVFIVTMPNSSQRFKGSKTMKGVSRFPLRAGSAGARGIVDALADDLHTRDNPPLRKDSECLLTKIGCLP